MSFFPVPGSHPGYITFNRISLGSSRLWQFLRFSLFLTAVWVLRSTGQVFCRIPLYWDSSDVFLMMKLVLRVLGRKTTKVKGHFHHIISREHIVNMNYHCYIDLDHLAEVVFVRCLCCKVTSPRPPPFLCCALWKEVTMCSPHLSGELCLTSLRVLFLHKLSESVLHGRFFSSPQLACLFACLVIYIIMDSWVFFIFWITIQYCFILLLKSLQLWLLGALSFGSCVPLTNPCCSLSCFVFERFFTFWHYKMLQAHLVYFLSQSWGQPFLQGALVPFYWRMVLETKIWMGSSIFKVSFPDTFFFFPNTLVVAASGQK